MIYLDNAATTYPKPELVYCSMDKMNRCGAVNANRGAYKLAVEGAELIHKTKGKLRKLVKAAYDTPVVLTPSITIALNQIINGINFSSGDIVYISPYEHNAVARTISLLKRKKNIEVKMLPLQSDLTIDTDQLVSLFSRYRPKLVVCTHISNVTGYVLPISEIFYAAHKFGAITVLDSAQSLGLLDIDVSMSCIDILSFAGHKSLYGPLGIGGFINYGNISLDEYIVGGTGSDSLNVNMPDSPESKYESSSTNIVAVAGLNAALDVLEPKAVYEHEKKLSLLLISELKKIDNIILYSNESCVGVISFALENFDSNDVGFILDHDYEICVRTGYHCAPYIHDFLSDANYNGTVRVGLSQYNTEADLRALINAIMDLNNQ